MQSLAAAWGWSQAFALKVLAGLVIFLAPVRAGITAVFWLVLIDMVFGLIASKKVGEKIESKKLAHTPLKFFVYCGSIVAVHLLEPEISLLAAISATKIVTGIIGSTELLSLLEKAQKITGAPVFAKIRDALKPDKSLK